MNNKELLYEFAKCIAVPVGFTDNAKWPIRAGRVIGPVRKYFSQEYISQLHDSKVDSNPIIWKKAFNNPSQLWRLSHHFVGGLSDLNLSGEEIANDILLHLNGILTLSSNNMFNRIGSHLIIDNDELHRISRSSYNESIEFSKALLHLSGLLWAFSETNYFVAHELICEYHGPYEIAPEKYIIIRDFRELHPVELWPQFNYDDLPSFIRIITYHNSKIDIGFDVYNNLFDNTGSIAKSIIGSSIVIDNNEVVSIDDITTLQNTISHKMMEIYSHISSMSELEIAHKYLDLFWYRKKSLSDYLNVSWQPNPDYHIILDETLKNGMPTYSSKGLDADIIAKYDYSKYIQ